MNVPLSVLEFRDRAAHYFGDKVGVVDGDRRFTYREYAQRTHRLAGALATLGIGPGDRVSFLTTNTHQLLEAYYGVLEAGAVLNPINIRLTADDIAYILNHSESAAIFYHRDFTPLVSQMRPALRATRHFVRIEGPPEDPAPAGDHDYEALLAAASPNPREPALAEDDVAEIFYTSGTTGRPKGVALTHRSLHLHALYASLGLQLTDETVMLHVVPLFHVNGWGTPHTVTLAGGTHVMLRKFDPASLLALVQRHRVTHLLGVPLIFNALVNFPALEQYDLSSLRFLFTGGAPASPVLIRTMQEKLGAQAMVGYGLTETSPVLSCARPRQHIKAAEVPGRDLVRRAMTGWAIPGVRLRVVDTAGQDVTPDGETIGEIVTRSNVVMEGYYRDPEATAAAIRDGWFHTGDMATIDETGDILIRDRAKDIIISGGENIASVEIENALYTHPDVLECAVVAAPDERWGEVPVAVVVPKPGRSPGPDELLVHLRGRLAGFKVPRQIELRAELPRGGTGKILKAEIREPYWRDQPKRVH
jgi:fatty-acyl-CoA synthase